MEPWLTESSRSSCQRLWLGRVYTSNICRNLWRVRWVRLLRRTRNVTTSPTGFLQNLVGFDAMRLANRTICDIVLLAQEFNRCEFNHARVKGFAKVYRQ